MASEKQVNMNHTEKYKPIGSDSFQIYGFKFGMYRYQVEFFDHNKSKDFKRDDPKTLRFIDYWDTLYGTRIYRFLDWEYMYCVSSALYMDTYIEKEDLKKMILDDVIEWKHEDPYDFKDRFIIEDNRHFIYFSNLFQADKSHVDHNYPICEEPYDKCPICGGELDYSVEETENAVDIFNSSGGYGYEGEYSGSWDEIHRCPHCNKLFCIEAYT